MNLEVKFFALTQNYLPHICDLFNPPNSFIWLRFLLLLLILIFVCLVVWTLVIVQGKSCHFWALKNLFQIVVQHWFHIFGHTEVAIFLQPYQVGVIFYCNQILCQFDNFTHLDLPLKDPIFFRIAQNGKRLLFFENVDLDWIIGEKVENAVNAPCILIFHLAANDHIKGVV